MYEGISDLNRDFLKSYPLAAKEYDAFWRALGSSSVSPNSMKILREGDLYDYRYPKATGDAALALLDEIGDLRFLDLIVDQLNAAKTKFYTDWRKMPNGKQAASWTRHPERRLPGRRRWLYQGTPRDPGGIDPSLYGTDLSNALTWHAHVARCTLALKNNRGKTSPQRFNYSDEYDYWRKYLLDDFEPLWNERNNFTFDTSNYREVIAQLAYARAMYLIEGRSKDNSNVVRLNGWRQGDEVTQSHEGVTIRGLPQNSEAGAKAVGESPSKPYGWQPMFVSHHTSGHFYHLYLMGTVNKAFMESLAHNLYYCAMIDGTKGNLATDLGGGGIPYSGATRTQLRTRDGGQYSAKHALSGSVKARYSARDSLDDGLWLPVRFGLDAFVTDLTTLRNRFSPVASGITPLDKAALCLARLDQAGFNRDGTLPTSPPSGGGTPDTPESPQNPEPPPYYAPSDPPDLRRYFTFEDVDVAERIPDFTLLPDRVDYDPGDPLQPPEASLPANYPNELIRYVRLLGNAVNQLIDERNTGSPSTGGGGGGDTGGGDSGGDTGGGSSEFSGWPDATLRWICWGRSDQPSNIGESVKGDYPLQLIGGAAFTENGIVCRKGSNPQYAMTDAMVFNMDQDFTVMSVVKDVANATDGAAYCAVASEGFNDGYVQAQQLGSNLQGVYRTLGSGIWAKTLDTPAQPLPFGGDGWRVVKIAKLGDNFAVTNVNRLALGDTPNKARLSFGSGTGDSFPNGSGGGIRFGAGIVPRQMPGTGIIGTGNFTLGALVVIAGGITDVQTVDWYTAFRNAQIAAGLSTVLTAAAV